MRRYGLRRAALWRTCCRRIRRGRCPREASRRETIVGREHFIGQRAYHADSGHEGVILDVHLDVRPQTAKFQHDNTEPSDSNWVNLEKLKLLPPGRAAEGKGDKLKG